MCSEQDPLSHFKRLQMGIQKFGFINGVDNVNWPPYRDSRISVRWPIYIINSVDKTKFLYTTSPPTQHHSFFRNYPFMQMGIFAFSQKETGANIVAMTTT